MKMVNDPNCPATRALTPTDIRQKLMRRLALYGRVREIESRQKTVEA